MISTNLNNMEAFISRIVVFLSYAASHRKRELP